MSASSQISVGSKFPTAVQSVREGSPAGVVDLASIFKTGSKVVVFGVPGAFTPGCSKTHLPGYINDFEKLTAKGVTNVICISVNDPFVTEAWSQQTGASGKVRILADPAAELTQALGLAFNAPPLGGVRSKRYSALVEDGVVTQLNVEPDGTGLSCSLSSGIKL